MIGQWTSQARKMVGIQTGSRQMALMRGMFCLALCVLISGMTPAAAAWHTNDSTPPQRLYAREADGILFSDDAEMSWTQAGALPSRPLAMAVAQGTPGLVFVGTESLGLLRSDDGGASWQPVDSAVLTLENTAPVAVTALAFDPEDEQIVYAATNIWLGVHTAHLTPYGVAVSVDGGRQWLQLSRAQPGDTPVWRLDPVAGQPLSVVATNDTGSPEEVSLKMSPELLGLLQAGNPAVRASAARALGLIGDAAAFPGLRQALADADTLAGQRIAGAIGRIVDRAITVGEINTEPARLALNPSSILAPIAARPIAPAPLAALPGAIPDVAIPVGPASTWTLAALAALLVLVLLAAVLIWKGPRPTAHLGPV